ncbi:MAG: hypothetical protein ACE5PM_05940 [Candidatus Hydrothermarchaeales archaeon]
MSNFRVLKKGRFSGIHNLVGGRWKKVHRRVGIVKEKEVTLVFSGHGEEHLG